MDDGKPDAEAHEPLDEYELFDPNEPGIFDELDDEAERLADEQSLADVAAGRFITHDAMKRWLLSWGTENPLPPPKCGE